MNLDHQRLMDAPSMIGPRCIVCGETPTTKHHLVPRSQGGANGPQVSLCGHGTTGHHGKAEDKRLHFFLDEHGKMLYLETRQPTKYERALDIGGWKPIEAEWNH